MCLPLYKNKIIIFIPFKGKVREICVGEPHQLAYSYDFITLAESVPFSVEKECILKPKAHLCK